MVFGANRIKKSLTKFCQALYYQLNAHYANSVSARRFPANQWKMNRGNHLRRYLFLY